MSRNGLFNNYKGFTLIEILTVMTIIGIITFISINFFNSVKARDQHHETRQRMDLITAKIRQYYQSQEKLPQPDDGNKLPVKALGLEQKYRLDAWGQYFEYYSATVNGCDEGFEVDIRFADGILISLGHNQKQDYTSDSSQNPCTFSTSGDDILHGLDLTAEKINIARYKLKVLQEKVAAYDDLFAGVDNNGDGIVDNVFDVGNPAIIEVDVFNTCPPTHSFTNDPSEGLTTLSEIEENEAYDCPPPLVFHIVEFYGLSINRIEGSDECDPDRRGGFDCDPWNRPFRWGYEGRARDDGTLIETSDLRYNRFYSGGPDETTIEDDIVFTGQ